MTASAVDRSSGSDDPRAFKARPTGPVPGKRYQIPAEQRGTAPGTGFSLRRERAISRQRGRDDDRVQVGPRTEDSSVARSPRSSRRSPPARSGQAVQIPAENASTARIGRHLRREHLRRQRRRDDDLVHGPSVKSLSRKVSLNREMQVVWVPRVRYSEPVPSGQVVPQVGVPNRMAPGRKSNAPVGFASGTDSNVSRDANSASRGSRNFSGAWCRFPLAFADRE